MVELSEESEAEVVELSEESEADEPEPEKEIIVDEPTPLIDYPTYRAITCLDGTVLEC